MSEEDIDTVVYAAPLGPDLALIVEYESESIVSQRRWIGDGVYTAYTIDGDANHVFTVAVTRCAPDGQMITLWSEQALARMTAWQKSGDSKWVGWPSRTSSVDLPNQITDEQIVKWGRQTAP